MIEINWGRYPGELLRRFKEFHFDNPEIYSEFENLARKIKSTGRKKYSALQIIGVIRWNRDVSSTGDVFKINNDFVSIYARLFVMRNPEFENFFEFREQPHRGIGSAEERERLEVLM